MTLMVSRNILAELSFLSKLIIQSNIAGGGAELDGGAAAVVVHAVVVAGVHAVVVELVAEGAGRA